MEHPFRTDVAGLSIVPPTPSGYVNLRQRIRQRPKVDLRLVTGLYLTRFRMLSATSPFPFSPMTPGGGFGAFYSFPSPRTPNFWK